LALARTWQAQRLTTQHWRFMEESWRNRSAADHQLMYEDLVRHPNRAPNRYASYTEGQSNASKGIRINRGVRRAYDAVRLWPMHFPKALGKFWRVVLKSRRCPALERRQRHFTRLRGAVWPCPWFGQVLLVIVLCVVLRHTGHLTATGKQTVRGRQALRSTQDSRLQLAAPW